MVTGRGLAGAFHHKLPKLLITIFATALLLANTINIGADLSGMADAAQMVFGFNSHLLVALFGLAITLATVFFRYHSIASILKWLALTLFAYVITAFVIGPDWRAVAHDTFIPSLPKGHAAWATMVAILGTTISPYLFFWQASQEIEEQKAAGRRMVARRGRYSSRIGCARNGCRRRHAIFKSCDVLHHPDNGADFASAWDY
jgi:Mn2+/Fe2+ NRAMP family transporter